MKKENVLLLSSGFALFSMFFGSGNLVFPLLVGANSQGSVVASSLGILCTAVVFPLLGMLAMLLYRGSTEAFFSCLGKNGTFVFSLMALALMGPFGVLARCLTVMHGSLELLAPQLSLPLTSALLCAVIFFMCRNRAKIVTLLGSYLTPFLLVAIALIVAVALHDAPPSAPATMQAVDAFNYGFFQGYQTMDLVAAFFFSAFMLKELAEERLFLKASLVASMLLYAVYFSLVLLGSLYAPLLAHCAPQEFFCQIALATLGTFGGPSVAVAITLACLTTAVALTSLFAEFLDTQVSNNKLGYSQALIVTLILAFGTSTLEFSGIARFLAPILETAYPALITLTVVNIAIKLRKTYGKKT